MTKYYDSNLDVTPEGSYFGKIEIRSFSNDMHLSTLMVCLSDVTRDTEHAALPSKVHETRSSHCRCNSHRT